MDEVAQRVARCFSAVFPTLSQDEIRNVGPAEFQAWDSLMIVTLYAALGEEFEVEVDDLIYEVNSFAALVDAVRDRISEGS